MNVMPPARVQNVQKNINSAKTTGTVDNEAQKLRIMQLPSILTLNVLKIEIACMICMF